MALKITKRVIVPTMIQVISVLQMLGLKKGAPLIRAPEYEEHDSQGPGAWPRGAVTLSKFPKEVCYPGATALQEQYPVKHAPNSGPAPSIRFLHRERQEYRAQPAWATTQELAVREV